MYSHKTLCHQVFQKRSVRLVFWLPALHPAVAFPSNRQWHYSIQDISGYSGGTATDFHRVPYAQTITTVSQ